MRDLKKTETVTSSDGKADKTAKTGEERPAKSFIVKIDIHKKDNYANNVYA